MSVQGKIAFVSGASRGIGASIAAELGRQGAVVLGTATTKSGVEKVMQILLKEGAKGKGYLLDVCDKEAIKVTLATVQADFGSPEILVNNAGITRDNIMLRMKSDQWNAVIETNLNAIFHLTKACLKSMIKARFGRIINISSVVAVTGNMGQANYVAAKAGVIGLTKVIAIEYAAYGITANCIAPGFIETEMTRAFSRKQQEVILAKVPMQRMGNSREIAQAVAFLASGNAGYITGETLHVNGGMCML
ncbi:3-oxoacyl-ACP reductase FabG [Coxiella endosymbiont of Amblyomma nuttalli]|uniref:3-oxoacyl-ACP reductase FabG n=1 Tax=Coxiella endosymbiont of Amblyomma nuttalli TaxID=2749996 RepID=UPI001BA9AF9C|nr:3-oxoacyl-ACP reductase FabG [Coxiella endosymbiont of Amblyomma nuttalli]QTS84103.1 3-oxoacyl-[acyl-carrier-protein] reductase FabG [Coxiella endosymbiont of Amblyomma nuttalli]